ncbi:uncharacterized protein LOC132628520 [Lycium barbarum]|uniref:uncharacterized protein LOC132628520 n=1 Tax=Lycium barbarum TaxID=112863 RepID=UPI00293E9A67|nr:uncharacterized protein LOC132628520 [Lycium barbarum]
MGSMEIVRKIKNSRAMHPGFSAPLVSQGKSNFSCMQLHSEDSNGQFEIVLGYTETGRAANNLTITHEVLLRHVGSGSHVHISLSKNGENVFIASGEPNSCERLMSKSRNSSFICWGVECKELTVRACCPPGAPDGVVTNFEIKTLDGSTNPHLGLASIIIAGIDGLRRKLPIQKPVGELHRLILTLSRISFALPFFVFSDHQNMSIRARVLCLRLEQR